MTTVESGFAILAAGLLLASVAGAALVADAEAADRSVSFEPEHPDVSAFSPTDEPGVATVGNASYDSLQAAVEDAAPGDTVRITGRFDERVVVETPNVTIVSSDGFGVLDGPGERDTGGGEDGPSSGTGAPGSDGTPTTGVGTQVGEAVGEERGDASNATVLSIQADNVTVDRVWIRNSGFSATTMDAGVWVNGTNTTIVDSRVTDVTFGIWINGVDDALVRNTTIVGHEDVYPLADRGNGIHLWETSDTVLEDNDITRVRDGIYFSWASRVPARNNTMWNLRYGVHYMYSDNCRLEGNVAFDNDVGFTLMVSNDLEIVDNVAVNNRGPGGHGILILQIEDTVVSGNDVVGNKKGFHMDNSQNIAFGNNLVQANDVGIHITSGSRNEAVSANSFVHNGRDVFTPMTAQKVWNDNYWSDASTVDLDRDGISEVRYRPAGMVEKVLFENPEATVFANSPAFDAVRMAESSFPVIESPGVVDNRPRAESHHDWRRYYED